MSALPPQGEFLLFQDEQGNAHIQVRLQDGTLWLSQKQMAELYDKNVRTINEHIQNIYEDGEQDPVATIRKFRIVQTEGGREVSRLVDFYKLDLILAVGYRVRSQRGTQFRRWATQVLNEYLIKGFVMDDERLKSGVHLGVDYFDELIERIRDIRASEKRFYQKITDIYATAIDYDAKSDTAKTFFATVQNKMHWAVHGHTAAELIVERVDSSKPNMGLTNWKGTRIRQADVTVAKNYLTEEEIRQLNLIVTMYLDYATLQAQGRRAMSMRDWADKLDAFLQFNDREVLKDAGKISNAIAEKLAIEQFGHYKQARLEWEAQAADEAELKVLEGKAKQGRKGGG